MDIDRTRRVGELIQRELAQIIAELSDPRIGLVTITDVKLTKDLKQAKVFVTEFTTNSEHEDLIKALANAANYLKRSLSQRLDLRSTPNLQFIYDASVEHGLKMTHLIEQARNKDKQ